MMVSVRPVRESRPCAVRVPWAGVVEGAIQVAGHLFQRAGVGEVGQVAVEFGVGRERSGEDMVPVRADPGREYLPRGHAREPCAGAAGQVVGDQVTSGRVLVIAAAQQVPAGRVERFFLTDPVLPVRGTGDADRFAALSGDHVDLVLFVAAGVGHEGDLGAV